ncbi:MAG: hypothetical protein N2255_06460, partial [Kiritimatiellae bacterium]|nr:hypothetical protein [Kiritimatiellia bacterium]
SEYEPAENRNLTRLYVGRKMQAEDSTPWLRVEKRMGALPALLCPDRPGKVFHVGMGSGVTVAWCAATLDKHVECAELVAGVARMRDVFRPHNEVGTFTIHIGDGRHRLLCEKDPLVLVVTDIVFPEDFGASNLFSVEYFRLVAERLVKGGATAHWLPLFQLPPETFKAIVRSFLTVFPEGTLWAGCVNVRRPVAMLFAVKAEGKCFFDSERIEYRIRSARMGQSVLRDIGLDTPEAVFAHLVAGPEQLQRMAGSGALYHDDRPLLEWMVTASAEHLQTWSVENMRLLLSCWQENIADLVKGRGTEIAPVRRKARYLLARAGYEAEVGGGVASAVALLTEAKKLHPDDAEISFALWDLLSIEANRALREGQIALAGKFIEEALRHGPLRDFLARDLAVIATACGATERALALAREAVRLDPGEPLNWETLEKVAHNAREQKEAVEARQKAAELRRMRAGRADGRWIVWGCDRTKGN